MFKKLVLFLVVVLGVIAGIAAIQPKDFKIQRSLAMKASPEVVFGLINDFHNWDRWSPWAKLDPQMKTSYSGAAAGPGAVYSWAGNNEVGEGSSTILTVEPSHRVTVKLDFLKPFAGTAQAEFDLKQSPEGVDVTWTMTGERNFVAKLVGLFMDCDSMVGGQFEKGLASLKSIVESKPAI